MTETHTIRNGQVLAATHDGVCILKLVGDIRLTLCKSMDEYMANVFSDVAGYKQVVVDVRDADAIDSTSLGLLAKVAIYAKKNYGLKPVIFSTNPSITKLLKSVGFDQIFNIETQVHSPEDRGVFSMLPVSGLCCEKEEKQRVIDAHKVLMSISEDNRLAFKDLVSSLEQEG